MSSLYRMQILDLGLEDPASKETLGSIQLFLQVTPLSSSESNDDINKQSKSIQRWKNVVSVVLLEANDLPAMDSNGEHTLTLTHSHSHTTHDRSG